MKEDVAIQVSNVSKDFLLPHEKSNSVKGVFTSIFRKKNKTKEVQHALQDIDFDIKKGEFFGIVGRNGSGKSTLLKILAGIYQPTAGKITVQGKLVPFIELGVGFNPELTGRENVYLNGAMLGFSQSQITAMYEDIVEFAELERFMDQKLKNYSSGMQVRLAFSMATRSEADILLVDEVLAVGDADFQRKCFEYFRKLKKSKKTVVFVSHDMSAVQEYCDRVVFIDQSKLKYNGNPEVAAEKYAKLFNKSASTVDENSARWGDGAATYSSVRAYITKETLTIKTKAVFSQDMEDPIFGILIVNSSGENVCGTNSKILKRFFGNVKAGESKDIVWELPNIFSDGSYMLDVAISHNDGVTQADWWHGAESFSVRNLKTTPYIVSPTVTLTIS